MPVVVVVVAVVDVVVVVSVVVVVVVHSVTLCTEFGKVSVDFLHQWRTREVMILEPVLSVVVVVVVPVVVVNEMDAEILLEHLSARFGHANTYRPPEVECGP